MSNSSWWSEKNYKDHFINRHQGLKGELFVDTKDWKEKCKDWKENCFVDTKDWKENWIYIKKPLYRLNDASRKFWLGVKTTFKENGMRKLDGIEAVYYMKLRKEI